MYVVPPFLHPGTTQKYFVYGNVVCTELALTIRPLPYDDYEDLKGRWRRVIEETNKRATRGERTRLHASAEQSNTFFDNLKKMTK